MAKPRRRYSSYIRYEENAAVVIDQQGNPKGTRVDPFDEWKGIPQEGDHEEEEGEEASEPDSESKAYHAQQTQAPRLIVLSFPDDNTLPSCKLLVVVLLIILLSIVAKCIRS